MNKTGLLAIAILMAFPGFKGPVSADERPGPQLPESEFLKKLVVSARAGWVDTGLDVEEGRDYEFRGEGEILLQKGNPEATCGPEGYDIRGIQQPIPEENLGCLLGKVVRLLAVRTDEKTGEEVRDELVSCFPVGRERVVAMPMSGRLFVGINENVVKDNDGEFLVSIFLRKSGASSEFR